MTHTQKKTDSNKWGDCIHRYKQAKEDLEHISSIHFWTQIEQ